MVRKNYYNDKIINKGFKGDSGRESKIANDFSLAESIRLDILINTILTEEQKQQFQTAMSDWQEFYDKSRNRAEEAYKMKQQIIEKKSIFEIVEEKRQEQEEEA